MIKHGPNYEDHIHFFRAGLHYTNTLHARRRTRHQRQRAYIPWAWLSSPAVYGLEWAAQTGPLREFGGAAAGIRDVVAAQRRPWERAGDCRQRVSSEP